MGKAWDAGLERDYLSHYDHYRDSREHFFWQSTLTMDVVEGSVYDLDGVARELLVNNDDLPLTREEIANLTHHVFVVSELWGGVNLTIMEMELHNAEDIYDVQHMVETAPQAEQYAFLEYKEDRTKMAQFILAILTDPHNYDIRNEAQKVVNSARYEEDIHDIFEEEITADRFMQFAAEAQRPDSQDFNPQGPAGKPDYWAVDLQLRWLARRLEVINHQSMFSPDGSITLSATDCDDLRRAISDTAYGALAMIEAAYAVGINYTRVQGVTADETLGEASAEHVAAYEHEIDYRIALLTGLICVLSDVPNQQVATIARSLAEAELQDRQWKAEDDMPKQPEGD